MSEFSLYAIDHPALEALVLRVLKIIGERDRKGWTAFVSELRRHPCWPLHLSSVGRVGGGCGSSRPNLTNPLGDEPLTARSIPAWDDARLMVALRELAQLSARHRFVGGLGRLHSWLVERPLAHPFETDAERAEFAALDTLVLRPQTSLPRHVEFLGSSSTHHSYVAPDNVELLARAVEAGGYLHRLSQEARREAGSATVGHFLDRLRCFLLLAASEGCGLFYQEYRT